MTADVQDVIARSYTQKHAHAMDLHSHLHLDLLLFEAATNQTLGGRQCVLGVSDSLVGADMSVLSLYYSTHADNPPGA